MRIESVLKICFVALCNVYTTLLSISEQALTSFDENGLTLLHKLIKTNNSKRFDEILFELDFKNESELIETAFTQKVDNPESELHGLSPLHIAVYYNYSDILGAFLKKLIEPLQEKNYAEKYYQYTESILTDPVTDNQIPKGFSLLHIAAYKNHKESIQAMLKHIESCYDTQLMRALFSHKVLTNNTWKHFYPLHLAAYLIHLSSAREMLAYVGKRDPLFLYELLNTYKTRGENLYQLAYTPLRLGKRIIKAFDIAAGLSLYQSTGLGGRLKKFPSPFEATEDIAILDKQRISKEKGFTVWLIKKLNKHSKKILHEIDVVLSIVKALAKQNRQLIKVLLSSVATNNEWKGYPPLHIAATNENHNFIRQILDYLRKNSLLSLTGILNQEANELTLADYYADEQNMDAVRSYNAIQRAHADLKKYQILLKSVTSRNSSRLVKLLREQEPLFKAIKTDAYKHLINIRNDNGETLLHIATGKGYTNIVDILISHGADVNIQDVGGYTPLNAAAWWGYKTIVELLLENGADPNIKSNKGERASDMAKDEIIREAILKQEDMKDEI